MFDTFPAMAAALAMQRAESVERRLRKLVDAGVSLERLFLLSDPSCECGGSGIVLELTDRTLAGRECSRCLGVAMIEVHEAGAPRCAGAQRDHA